MLGIDVSHYDGWPYSVYTAEAYEKAEFVIVKATQGVSYMYESYFPLAIEKALKDGKLIGAYHYAAGNEPEEEAEYFAEVIKPYLGKIVVALDWEQGQNAAWGSKTWCKRFVDYMHEITGLTCMLYTGMDGTHQCENLANKVPLWFAGYPKNENSWMIPKWPSYYTTEPWGNYTVWQFTSGEEKVDRDFTNMTPADWNALAAGNVKGYEGEFPKMPKRGYYRAGDGMTALSARRKQIKRLQKVTNWITAGDLEIDGKYGQKTAAEVVQAQRTLGVVPDGLFGKTTLKAAKAYKK